MKPGIPSRESIRQRVLTQPGLIDAHTHVGSDAWLYYTGGFPYCLSAEDAVLRMDLTGVPYAVCFPMLYTAYFSLPDFVQGRFVRSPGDLCPVPYQYENQRLCTEIYEAFPATAARLLLFAFFDPGRDQAAQVTLLETLIEDYPIFGVKTATSYLKSHITELLGPGQCLLDFAASHDLPVMLHTAVLPGDPWANVFDLLQVVTARPDVRFCLAHTCRFDRRALDQATALPNCYVDLSAFHIHSKLAVDNHAAVAAPEHRFPADYAQQAVAMQAIAEAYPDTILWGSDVPANQWMSKWTDVNGQEHWLQLTCEVTRETDELRKLPEPLQQRIGYANTIRYLFGSSTSDSKIAR